MQGRNRRCITIDLHNQEGREVLRRLANRADVLVENFRPGVMENWQVTRQGAGAVLAALGSKFRSTFLLATYKPAQPRPDQPVLDRDHRVLVAHAAGTQGLEA